MQQASIDDVVLKISEVRNNKFWYNVFFTRIAKLDSFSPTGMMTIVFECNGKKYSNSCKCSSSIMDMVDKMGGPRQAHLMDLEHAVRRLIIFQLGLLLAQVLLENTDESLMEIFKEIHINDPLLFDANTLRENLNYEYA
jgi:hypothetical protein